MQTNARTFYAAIERWKADVDEKVKLPGYKNKNIPVLLMCNKSDRPKDPNLPSDLEISEIVQNHNFIPKWIKTSAKTGAGVREAFNIIVRYTQRGHLKKVFPSGQILREINFRYVMTMDTWNQALNDPDGSLVSEAYSFYQGNVDDDEVFEATNDQIVRLEKMSQRSASKKCLC